MLQTFLILDKQYKKYDTGENFINKRNYKKFLLPAPPPPLRTRSSLLPGDGYDSVVHSYTYRDWMYQVPVTHVGNGAELCCVHYLLLWRHATSCALRGFSDFWPTLYKITPYIRKLFRKGTKKKEVVYILVSQLRAVHR